MDAPEPGRGSPHWAIERTVPPAHVWRATKRKFFFENLPMRKGGKFDPACSPAPSSTILRGGR